MTKAFASGASGILLDVERLSVRFGGGQAQAPAVHDLSFRIGAGEAVALVGESGCGKSTTALALMGLLPERAVASGRVGFGGRDLLKAPPRAMQAIRGNAIGMIFQEPMSSLNPVYRIGDQIIEALRCHRSLSYSAARRHALELLDIVRLPAPERQIDAYPHRLSGGQRQRAMIAMAIACEPKLLIADEPTTALDATIQAQILELLDSLRKELSMALLLITHDLGVVARWAERVIVMHHGERMEELPAADLFTKAAHPYTRGLIGASIRLDQRTHYETGALAEIRSSVDEKGRYSFDMHVPARALARSPPVDQPDLLAVENLVVDYQTAGWGRMRAVDNVSFTVGIGETVGLVGESGCGKSTLSKSIMRLLPTAAGRIIFHGRDITHLDGEALKPFRPRMQMIFQDPYASLNPRRSVHDILTATLVVNGVKSGSERSRLMLDIIGRVGLPVAALQRYPHEFSGGQRQRIGIARALIVKPSLVVCDEPVSALDVSIQAQILNLLVELKQQLGLSYIFISHDLAVVQYISDRVLVMKDARIIEQADHETIWKSPREAYTKKLIAAAA